MRRRVLSVDDHPSFRRFATRLLERAGFCGELTAEALASIADGAP
jgi:CheY-like chemotaxis protein